jgi:hypothetical protein
MAPMERPREGADALAGWLARCGEAQAAAA